MQSLRCKASIEEANAKCVVDAIGSVKKFTSVSEQSPPTTKPQTHTVSPSCLRASSTLYAVRADKPFSSKKLPSVMIDSLSVLAWVSTLTEKTGLPWFEDASRLMTKFTPALRILVKIGVSADCSKILNNVSSGA